jgi:hypothetical protein
MRMVTRGTQEKKSALLGIMTRAPLQRVEKIRPVQASKPGENMSNVTSRGVALVLKGASSVPCCT